MKKQVKPWISAAVAVLSVLNVALYYSMHSMWSGIIAILGKASPYIVYAVMFVVAAAAVYLSLSKKSSLVLTVVTAVFSLFFLAVEGYIFSQTRDSYMFFVKDFLVAAACVAAIFTVIFFVFYYPNSKLKDSKLFKTAVVVAVIAAMFLGYFTIFVNGFTCIPAVYAVGDEYQIVFTTRIKGTAWVKINGVEYCDTYAGSKISEETVHKVTVPMSALDGAKSYSIYTKAMFLRGPYSACQGRTLSETYSWRGIDTSDGLQYYVFSDSHTQSNAITGAATYFGDDLDLLICAGDAANWVDRPADLAPYLKVVGDVAKGEIPVVYARGNHETKGRIADELYRYVGSVNQKFYFTFRLGNIWGIVLDLGEDHGDDWSEFYDSSRFVAYRDEQTEFLDGVLADAENEFDALGVDYRIAVCHMPVTFKYREDNNDKLKDEWIERLNQMKLTVMFGGHRHQIMYVDPEWEAGTPLTYAESYCGYAPSKNDGVMTDADFPSVLVSRKSTVQEISTDVSILDIHFFGAAVEVADGKTVIKITNEDHKPIENIVSPWFEGVSYGSEIVLVNK